MVTESPTLDDRALADDVAVVKERLLPLIRIRTYRPLTYFPERQEIIGLFPDEIIRVRVRKTVAVPETIYEPGGA